MARCLSSEPHGIRSCGYTSSTQFTHGMCVSNKGEPVSTKARRLGSLLAALAACLVLLTPGALASAYSVEPEGGPGQATIAVEADSPDNLKHLIDRAPSSSVIAWRVGDQAGRGGQQSRHGGS